MKLTKSKQFLADAIRASGKGWPDVADFASQDKDMWICLYDGKPTRRGNAWKEEGDCLYKLGFSSAKLSPNWHQTVLSREEYFSAYPAEPAADADGWIEWNGGECPVDAGVSVEVKRRSEWGSCLEDEPESVNWKKYDTAGDIIAYRLHKPAPEENLSPEAVMDAKAALTSESIEGCVRKPTIEQLAADYRNAKDYAERKQQEADDAKATADAALGKLELAGNALGLIIAIANPRSEWIEWGGGECPVQKGTLVDIKTRDGTVVTSIKAGVYIKGQNPDASPQFWDNDGMHNDIVSYRIYR